MTEHNLFTPLNTQAPFQNIALAFSGGGFRAAAYALGVLSYLNEIEYNGKPLIQNVKFISSASGGSLATAIYAISVAKEKSFDDFYKKLYENLAGNKLLDRALKILNNSEKWNQNPGKKRNMINAFALAYEENFTDKCIFNDLYNSYGHLEEICLNATEFYRGTTFRQNIKMKYDQNFGKDINYKFGNSLIYLNSKAAKRIKISDSLAASACFPGGFEPIIFPSEFTYHVSGENETSKNKYLTQADLLSNLNIQLKEYKRNELERLYGKKVVQNLIDDLKKAENVNFIEKSVSEDDWNPVIKEIKKKLKGKLLQKDFKFGLMDGGATDNQGLESLLSAYERRVMVKGHKDYIENKNFQPFDFMLISDVGSHFMDPYQPAEVKQRYRFFDCCSRGYSKCLSPINWAKPFSVFNLFIISAIVILASSITICCLKKYLWIKIVGTILITLSALVIIAILWIRKKVSKKISNLIGIDLSQNFTSNIVGKLFNHFKKIQTGVIFRMAEERASSLLVLNNDVFLKRIRFLLYNRAYESRKYKNKLKTNHVYDLTFSNDSYRFRREVKEGQKESKNIKGYNIFKSPENPASNDLKKIAQTAFSMPTTLWFEESNSIDRRAAIIATGQFTTCYNLLMYIENFENSNVYKQFSTEDKKQLDSLKTKLKCNFEKFNNDPFWMYNQYGIRIKETKGLDSFKKKIHQQYEMPLEFQGLR